MARDWTDTYSFTRGAAAESDCGYLVLCNDELSRDKTPHGLCVQWNAGRWKQVGVVNHLITSVCTFGAPPKSLAALGEFGMVLLFGTARRDEEIEADGQSPRKRGPLRCIREVEGNLYAAGMNRQVYQRIDDNRWLIIDNGTRPKDQKEVVGFEGIDGFAARELYAAGWRGEIWKYDGDTWKQIDSPTNVILTDVCCAGDGNVYVCGRLGVLLRGRYQSWTPVEHESTGEDFWSMAWHNGKLYLATTRSVYVLVDDALERVDFGSDLPATCYQLSSSGGVLWSIGAKDVMAFDGSEWTRID